jgi:hypothetical protein
MSIAGAYRMQLIVIEGNLRRKPMNISDLNYLESVEVNVVGGYARRTEVKKDIDLDVDFDLNIDTNIDFYKDFEANIYISSDVNVQGNSSSITFDVEAIGDNSVVEVDLVVLTTDRLSSVSGSIIAAVD